MFSSKNFIVSGLTFRENHNSKRHMHPMFIAALFTIARTWKQPKCPSTEEWIKEDVIHIYNGISLSHEINVIRLVAAR